MRPSDSDAEREVGMSHVNINRDVLRPGGRVLGDEALFDYDIWLQNSEASSLSFIEVSFAVNNAFRK